MIDVRFAPLFDPRGVRPEVWGVMPIVETCAMLLGARQLIWSSGADKLHGAQSLHYAGCAVDADVPGWGRSDFAQLAAMVRHRLRTATQQPCLRQGPRMRRPGRLLGMERRVCRVHRPPVGRVQRCAMRRTPAEVALRAQRKIDRRIIAHLEDVIRDARKELVWIRDNHDTQFNPILDRVIRDLDHAIARRKRANLRAAQGD